MELAPLPDRLGAAAAPTLVLWMAFIAAVAWLTRSRYATYGIGLAALIVTVFFFMRGHMSWVGNWPLIPAAAAGATWAPSSIDRPALCAQPPAGAGPGRSARLARPARLRPPRARPHAPAWWRREAPAADRLTAVALTVPALALGIALWFLVNQGFQGAHGGARHKDYWRENLATWMNQPLPYVTRVEMDIDLHPADGAPWTPRGFYDLQNQKTQDLDWFAVTGGIAWKGLAWTLDGQPWKPEERARPLRLPAAEPLAPGASVRLGFRYHGTVLPGVSRNGGELDRGEFILPSGVLVTGRNPDFVPVIGFDRADRRGREEPHRAADLPAALVLRGHRRRPRPLGLHPAAADHARPPSTPSTRPAS